MTDRLYPATGARTLTVHPVVNPARPYDSADVTSRAYLLMIAGTDTTGQSTSGFFHGVNAMTVRFTPERGR